ncbi:hypothetical protein KZZ52_21160 [Dactylosporangium sp. AC04546]|uniref:hypothetical protein n=1 Tax=Dactylosporangium sp. AC04546 TaxID=2862460 RepID=UPI001EDEA97B|nr:hypothetical protein [Dactylosporangium sp. AC04546]WVK87796.1 hypothetical protein KZZ52_21160 [Dactylosporangium sp. AC04546]
MLRRGASIALLAVAASTLAACPQPTLPLLALGRTADGRPVVHLRLCKEYQPGLQLRTDPPDRFGDILWRVNRTVPSRAPETIELGVVPQGWAAEALFNVSAAAEPSQPAAPQPSPTGPLELQEGVVYRIDVFAQPPPTPLHFTLAELEQLGPDQVRTDTVMTRAEFDRKAADAC